jgi:ribonuclease P protein component
VRVQTYGERATSAHFVLLVAAREVPPSAEPGGAVRKPDSLPSRLGVVATRKIGDATMRNRIKRVCRECFRQWPGFVPDGIDLVVIAREGADTLPLARVREEWTRARPALLKRCESVLRRDPNAPPPPRPPRSASKGEAPKKAEKARTATRAPRRRTS